MNTFVIADPHLGHPDIILHCRRPWCVPNPAYTTTLPFDFKTNNPLMVTKDSLEEHDQFITDRWNGFATKKDRVIILGDFAFRDHFRHLSSLNGRKILIMGNHDDMSREALKHFEEVHDFGCVKKMPNGLLHPDGGPVKEKVTFCHYAMRAWPGSWDGTASLHGHSHGRMPELDILLSFDVGVDVWGYFPIPWEAIQKRIADKRVSMGSRVPSEYGDGRVRGSYSSDPDERVVEIRKKNMEALKAVGVAVPDNEFSLSEDCQKAMDVQKNADKMMTSVVAVADTVNAYGRAYTRDSLRPFADGRSFFWDEATGTLTARCRSGVIGNKDAATKMFRDRLVEVSTNLSSRKEDQNGQASGKTV